MRYKMSQVFVKINILRISPLLLFFSLLSAQWFEGNLYLPDSFSGTGSINSIIWNSIDDKLHLSGLNETFVSIDCETDEKVQPIRINGNERSHPVWSEWNGGNNHLYIWCSPYRAYLDSLHIIDCRTRQVDNIISFPRRSFSSGHGVEMCSSPISNKVYFVKTAESLHCDTAIYVIDGFTHQIVKTIRFVGMCLYSSYPSLKWNSINNCLYLFGYTLSSDTGLAVIDCSCDSIIAFIPLSFDIGNIYYVLDTIRNKLYVSIKVFLPVYGYKIYEIDCTTNQITREFEINSLDFALNPTAGKIYYPNDNHFILIYNINTGSVEDSIFVMPNLHYGVRLIYYSSNNELYFVSQAATDSLGVINLTTNEVNYYKLPDERGASGPFLHPIREKLYIIRGGGGDAIVVFDCQTKTVRKVICTGISFLGDVIVNPIENKIYCAIRSRPYIFVFDSESNRALHQFQVAPSGRILANLGFAPLHNKIYISYQGHIAVLDCRTDSIIKVIDGLASVYAFAYNPILDKLYTLDVGFFGAGITYVIDCANDSVIKQLPTTQSSNKRYIKFDSLTNKVYMTGMYGGSVIIDCLSDSIIKRDTTVYGSILFRAHEDKRVYIDDAMFDRYTDSLLGYLPFTFRNSEYSVNNDRLYLALFDKNNIYVVDCHNHTLIDSIVVDALGCVLGLFWNQLNNKLYFSPMFNENWYQPVMVADCQTNEIVATFPQIDRSDLDRTSCLNLSNNRFYVPVYVGSKLGIIRDNIPGIEECNMLKTKSLTLEIYPNPAKSVMRVRCPLSVKEIKIFDVLGKLVKEEIVTSAQEHKQEVKISLKGINPGIYFLRLGKETKKFLVVK